MEIAYVDESNKGNWVSFGAVVAEPDVVLSLTAALNKIVEDASWYLDIPRTTELHGYEIFHGTDGWKGIAPRPRIRIYRAVLEAIVAHNVKIVIRWCERDRLLNRQQQAGYPNPWGAEQTVFQFLLQRINSIARTSKTQAMVIVDIRDDREEHRERFATYQRSGTPGDYMSTRLAAILDTVHFVPSHHSRMIQAADMVTYMHRRYKTITESDPRAQKVVDSFRTLMQDSDRMHQCGSWP